jgi:hypothetical protein
MSTTSGSAVEGNGDSQREGHNIQPYESAIAGSSTTHFSRYQHDTYHAGMKEGIKPIMSTDPAARKVMTPEAFRMQKEGLRNHN